MNKSKFLKKSLAMILAVMLVVAMIPLGASAEKSVDLLDGKVFQSLTATEGELSGTEPSFEDAIPYSVSDATEETLALVLQAGTGYTKVNYTVTAKDGTETTGTGLTIKARADSQKVTFYAADKDETKKSATYTVTFDHPAPSPDVKVKAVRLDDPKEGLEGTFDNSKLTISFTNVPWNDTLSGHTAYVYLEEPVSGNDPQSFPITIGTDAPAKLLAQLAGNYVTYTISSTEAACLGTLSVGSTAAVWDEENKKYVVTLPQGTDLAKDKQMITYTANSAVKVTKVMLGTEDITKNGEKHTIAEGNYKLVFTSDKQTTKTYDVTIAVGKSDDATISAFTAKATANGIEYEEAGEVNDNNLTVLLPADSDLTSVKVQFTVAAGAAVKVNNATHKNDGTDAGYNLKNGNLVVEVTAPDEQHIEYYRLSATVAEKTNSKPAITGAALTIGKGTDAEAKYDGVISDKTITFKVPYATVDTNVTGGTFAWTKTFATTFVGGDANHITWLGDPFEKGGEVVIKSDAGDGVTYTIVVEKDAPKTGKTLTNLSISTATAKDALAADNTYVGNIASKKVSFSKLPYSYETKTDPTFVLTFEVPEGAALYYSLNGAALTALTSGYDAETGANKNSILRSALFAVNSDKEFTTKLIVADEKAKVKINGAASVTLAQLDTDDYKDNVTIYEVAANYADAQTGHSLTDITTKDGLVTSKVSESDRTIEITVPWSYVGKDFFPVYTASTLATVTAGSVVLPTTAPADTTVSKTGMFKVAGTASAASLEVYNGLSSTPFTAIKVDNEAGTAASTYTVIVKVAAAETGAQITSLKVDGVAGTINHTEKTVDVTVGFGKDLSSLPMEFELSKLATTDDPLANYLRTDDDGVKYYNVSNPFKITVTAEDGKTINGYTVTVKALDKFSDVVAGAYYYDYVYAAAEAGVIMGYEDGSFKPNNNVTRGEFAAFVTRMLGVDVSSYTTTTFTDVPADHYQLKYIAYLSEAGIVAGDGTGKFNPNAPITREDAAVIVAKALKLGTTTSSTSFADDAKISGYAKKYVAACAKAELIKGMGNNTYSPLTKITRGQAAVILAKSLDK